MPNFKYLLALIALVSIYLFFSEFYDSESYGGYEASNVNTKLGGLDTDKMNIDYDKLNLLSGKQVDEIRARLKHKEPGRLPDSFFYDVSNIFDNTKITNEHETPFILKPNIAECQSKRKLLVLAVYIIGVDMFEKRQVIRQEWKKISKTYPNMKAVFAIGLSKNEKNNQRAKSEAKNYKDILQDGFIDSYYNLTQKTIGVFKYLAEDCPNGAQFLLRTCDDFVVNAPILVDYLNNIVNKLNGNVSNLYMGFLSESNIVTRQIKPGINYAISKRIHENDVFLPYISGAVCMFTTDVAVRQYELSRRVYWPPFSSALDDVYMGYLCLHLACEFVTRGEFYHLTPSLSSIREKITQDPYRSFFFKAKTAQDYEKASAYIQNIMSKS